jgi:hypothetical protein
MISQHNSMQQHPVCVTSRCITSRCCVLITRAQCCVASKFIEQTFTTEYPKVSRILLEFWRRLQTHYEIKHAGSLSLADERSDDEEELLLRSSAKFETAYLLRVQTRLFEPINTLFPTSARSPPSTEEVDGLTRVVVQEFEQAASGGIPLCVAVAKIVSKAVQLFAIKCEGLVCGSDFVRQAERERERERERGRNAYGCRLCNAD